MNPEAQKSLEKRKKCPACSREFTGTLVVCKHDGTLLIPIKEDLMIGTTLADKYRIESEIGRGGMSVVYKGRHELMDRMVAIKMLQAQLVNDQTSIKRFKQEAKAASCLTHSNVITVYDCDVSPGGQPYLVMDYLVGESLADIIKRENHVEEMRALNIFIQACDALEHAHLKGVLHRDLKSSNIMLVDFEGKTDVVKVVDFGIAKLMPNSGKQSQNLTQTGEIFGSPIYMSPEQCLGSHLDARSDIYSMGAMLYESLMGMPPLMGDTIIDTMQMHVSTVPASFADMRHDLNIHPQFEAVVFKALEKKPEDRYASMEQFRDALAHVARTIEMDKFEPRPVRDMSTMQPRSTKQNLSPQRNTNAGALPKPQISSISSSQKIDSSSAKGAPVMNTPMGSISRVSQTGMKAAYAPNSKMNDPTRINKSKLGDLKNAENKASKSKLLIGAGIMIALALILAIGLAIWVANRHVPT
ncbi:MAG: serine/threonine protein kinase [Candidatus Melainabacteria bacterium]|nr:serine/threonine protein kinase [Candidatus Melainabacteria bacterium]